ncbi:hypothetical protein [Nocardioides aromaticivorans]|nr:hypothetical protein [Nocardioides aromaticivorans]
MSNSTTPDEAPNPATSVPASEPDPTLGAFVAAAERRGSEEAFGVPVTLWVGGTIVTGLIQNRRYWAKAILAGLDEGATFGFDRLLEVWEEAEASDPDHENRVYTFVHLTEARTFMGSQFVPESPTMPWRGRLDAIDGWTFGTLTSE